MQHPEQEVHCLLVTKAADEVEENPVYDLEEVETRRGEGVCVWGRKKEKKIPKFFYMNASTGRLYSQSTRINETRKK